MIKIVLLAACALTPFAAAAQQPGPPTVASSPVPHPRAEAIARIMLPLDKTVEAAARAGKKAYFEMFKSNPDVAELEKLYPGISDAIWPVFDREVRKIAADDHPSYLDMVASFYSSRFTPAELEAIQTLYMTPTGAKMIAAMYGDTGPNAMIDAIVSDPEAPVSQEAVDETIKSRTGRVVKALTKDDEAPILAALRVVPEEKLTRVNGELAKLVVDWLNRPTPEIDARLDATLGKAMEDYMAAHPPKD